jgi:hypothetical protein
MLNGESSKELEEKHKLGVNFLRRTPVLNIWDLKKIIYNNTNNMASFKGERGVHFLWK